MPPPSVKVSRFDCAKDRDQARVGRPAQRREVDRIGRQAQARITDRHRARDQRQRAIAVHQRRLEAHARRQRQPPDHRLDDRVGGDGGLVHVPAIEVGVRARAAGRTRRCRPSRGGWFTEPLRSAVTDCPWKSAPTDSVACAPRRAAVRRPQRVLPGLELQIDRDDAEPRQRDAAIEADRRRHHEAGAVVEQARVAHEDALVRRVVVLRAPLLADRWQGSVRCR